MNIAPRREHSRKGWLILSGGRPWDQWVYRTEEAAKRTIEQCRIPEAEVVEGRQNSVRLLADRKWR